MTEQHLTEFYSEDIELTDEQADWVRDFRFEIALARTELREVSGNYTSETAFNELTTRGMDVGFEVTLTESGQNWLMAVHSPAHGDGSVENAAAFIESVLNKFDRDDVTCLEWSSRSIFDGGPQRGGRAEFSGGAGVITKEGSDFINPGMIAAQKIRDRKDANAAPKL